MQAPVSNVAIDPTCCFGNPNLKPESSNNFNGSCGGRIQRGETTIDLEFIGFYRKVSDLIVDTDDGTGSGNTITANSEDAVRVHGFGFVGRVNWSLDLHPPRKRYGATLTFFWVGEIFDNVSGFGSVPCGDYAVVDLAGRYFLDAQRRHRLNVRLENLFDSAYATGHGRAFADVGGLAYLTSTLGVPRTLHCRTRWGTRRPVTIAWRCHGLHESMTSARRAAGLKARPRLQPAQRSCRSSDTACGEALLRVTARTAFWPAIPSNAHGGGHRDRPRHQRDPPRTQRGVGRPCRSGAMVRSLHSKATSPPLTQGPTRYR